MHIAYSLVLQTKAIRRFVITEKALVGAFPVIVQPVVEPMDRFAALAHDIITVV